MTAALELARIAAAIPIPVDAQFGRARAYVQVVAGRHQVYFGLDGGIRRSPGVGPLFERPRDAIRLVDLINGEAPLPGQPDLAVLGSTPSRDVAGQTEAPGSELAASERAAGEASASIRRREAPDTHVTPSKPSRPSQDELGR